MYILDSNIFIRSAREYYAFDIVPRFWDVLIQQAHGGRIQSIDHVKNELLKGNDDLAKWAKADFAFAFAPTTDNQVVNCYKLVMMWANSKSQYTQAAKAQLATSADGWLVAYAKAYNFTVATNEQSRASSKKRVLLPDICEALGVLYVGQFEMMRQLGMKFP